MKSIRTVYKIGFGPSSSHTVGPYNAAIYFKNKYPDCDKYEVILYGSLAYTGEGHGTKNSIKSVIPEAIIYSDIKTTDLPHPNTMLFIGYKNNEIIKKQRIFSIGGGSLKVEDEPLLEDKEIYPEKNFTEMMDYCQKNNLTLSDFVFSREDSSFREYLEEVWEKMEECIERGLNSEGILPGGLNIARKAKGLLAKRCYNESSDIAMDRTIAAYAYAACEENADMNLVVTAPTCGSCGVLPAVLYYMHKDKGYPKEEIINALAVSGLIGNVIRTNASISGAECGCQAEIGSACCMTASGLAALYNLSNNQIEYAGEVAMEHSLGLTCDPVKGLVQIPCIERNAVAAMRAVNSVNLSRFLYETRKISLDNVIATMYQTGKDLNEKYRETSHGGLAALYEERK